MKWLSPDLPRTAFRQDLLYSLGAFLTVCEIKRHDALRRLESLVRTGRDPGWAGGATRQVGPSKEADTTPSDEETSSVDIERYAADRISARIAERFAGHRMAYLIQSIFAARGMTTWLSPEGPDGGVDVLVGSGPLGMDAPRICVQVKSSSSAVEAGIVRELQGVVGRLKADQGLLVAWGGLTRDADREIRQQFFHVRVWKADDVLRELTAVYEKLPGDIQADLPLKRVWSLADGEEAE